MIAESWRVLQVNIELGGPEIELDWSLHAWAGSGYLTCSHYCGNELR